MPILLDLPLTPSQRRRWGEILAGVIHPIAVLGVLAVKVRLGMIERANAVYTVDQVCRRGLYCTRSLKKRLEGWTSRMLMRFPRLALWVIRAVYRLVHRRSLFEDEEFRYLLGREGVVVENGIPRARK
jgi:hypothetical protein